MLNTCQYNYFVNVVISVIFRSDTEFSSSCDDEEGDVVATTMTVPITPHAHEPLPQNGKAQAPRRSIYKDRGPSGNDW